MKQAIIAVSIMGLIFSCSTRDTKSPQIDKNITLGENIYLQDYDNKTGWTRILLKEPKCWGYIDKDSNVVIPFIFEFLNPFDSVGMAVGQIGEKHGFINTNCDTVVPFIYDDLSVYSEGLASAKKNGKYGYLNREGEVVIPFQYDKSRHFYRTGLSEASKDGKWGFINKKGEEVVPIIYSEVDCHKMEKELIFVCSSNKWAIFDKYGKQRTEFTYDEIYGTSNNFDYFDGNYLYNELLLTRKGNQYRYLNQNLEIVADFGYYTIAEPISEFGFAIVRKGNYYGVINSENKVVVPCNYFFIEHPKKPYQGFYDEFYIHKNGKIGILNEKAELIADVTYDSFERDYSEINDSKQVVFRAKKNNQYGIINKKGEIILPIE